MTSPSLGLSLHSSPSPFHSVCCASERDEDVLVEDERMHDLITKLAIENPCTISELALVDDDLAVCADFSDDR